MLGAGVAGVFLVFLLLLRFQPLARANPLLGRFGNIVVLIGYATFLGLSAFHGLQQLPPQLRSDATWTALKAGVAIWLVATAAQKILELRPPALDASGGATRP